MKNQSNLNAILKILIALAVSLFCVMLFWGYKVWQRNQPKADLIEKVELAPVGNQKKPVETKPEDEIVVTLQNYKVFTLNGLDFKFVIANINVKSKNPINLELNHFKTSENIVLNDVEPYVNQLEDHSLFLGRQNVWFSLISNDTELSSNIFIPVKDTNANSISLITDFANQKEMSIDLTKNPGTAELLYYQAEDVISDGKTYQMKVSAAYDITGEPMYQMMNGVQNDYLLPSTTKVYAFNIEAVSLWGDAIELDSAVYVPENSKEQFDAMDSSIRSMKLMNILGKEITEKDSGYLFFYAYDPDENPVTYKGSLKLKLKNRDSWITVNVDLN